MTKSLRRGMILVAMSSILFVLAVIVAVANLVSYGQVRQDADRLVTILLDNGGEFGAPPTELGEPTGVPRRGEPGGNELSPETPYETRFFSAVISNESATIISTNVRNIAALNMEQVRDYLTRAYVAKGESGYLDTYRYGRRVADGMTQIVLVDCTRQLSTANAFLRSSLIISLAGSGAVLILVLLLSSAAVKPIEEGYRKQKRFITDSGHEIKTPLSIISANTEVLEMEYGENEWTRSIRHQVERMNELTHRLTRLARMDEQENLVQANWIDLGELVLQSATAFSVSAETKEKEITLETIEHVPVYGETETLTQLLSILMDNAVKYAFHNIQVGLVRRGQRACLTVCNDVEGDVTPGSLESFFDRFWRADSARSQETPGFGIGLSLARSIVTAHHGMIRADSEDGKHVTITVLLKAGEDNKLSSK